MKVALLQINNSFSGQNYLPYSAAILESYFLRHGKSSNFYEFLPYIYKRASVQEIINEISSASVLGLSLYAWNTRLSLAVARAFRQLKPDALIFAGGPSVPDEASAFLSQNPFLNLVLHNEGESSFTDLLDAYASGQSYTNILSASYVHDSIYVKNPNAPRIADLSTIPSPFLTGCFDKVLDRNPNERWIGLWETNRGCPFTCTYCDWGSATGSKKIGMFEYSRLEDEMAWFSKSSVEYIFCCDANFGMFPRDPQIAEMVGSVKSKTGYPHALSVQNTKNSTERSYQTQKILCDYGLNKGVTLSMQTLSDDALKNIKRSNIRLSSYFELQKRFIDESVPTYSDLILALPGETLESYITGMCQLIESGQHNRIQFNNLSILPNAEMAQPEYRDKFAIKTVTTNIVNMHGSLSFEDESVMEKQELVISTSTLPYTDWKQVRAISWLVSFLYFDKVAQVPLAIANGALGIPFKFIIDELISVSSTDYPVIDSIYRRFVQEAQVIKEGGPEYIYSKEYLGIYWPIDELLFIEMVLSNTLGSLYEELSRLLSGLLERTSKETYDYYGADQVANIFKESCDFNAWLINSPTRLPSEFTCNWSIASAYQSRLNGNFSNLEQTCIPYVYTSGSVEYSNLNDWLQHVVWYGNKRGAYLVDFEIVSTP